MTTYTASHEFIEPMLKDKETCAMFLDLIILHLEYLQLPDLVKIANSYLPEPSDQDIKDLDNIITKGTEHILSWPLSKSILVHLSVEYINNREKLIERLSKQEIALSIKNIISPDSDVLNPPTFKGSLYPPQGAILSRMLDLEQNRVHTLFDKQYAFGVGIVPERIGFGKTHLCAALLAYPVPSTGNIAENITQIPTSNRRIPNERTEKTNIVICNAKTLVEWKENLEKYTDLSVVRVNSAKKLEEFIELYKSDKPLPDVILVKDGKVNNKLLVQTVSEAVGSNLFNRVVIDDYDVLNLDKTVGLPMANFYWLVSSTRHFGNRAKGYKKSEGDISLAGRPTIDMFERNIVLFDMITSVKCLD